MHMVKTFTTEVRRTLRPPQDQGNLIKPSPKTPHSFSKIIAQQLVAYIYIYIYEFCALSPTPKVSKMP